MAESIILRGGLRDGLTLDVRAWTRFIEVAGTNLTTTLRYERTDNIEKDRTVYEYKSEVSE